MFKRTATDLDTQPTTTDVCAQKRQSLLPNGCFCLNDTGNGPSSDQHLTVIYSDRWIGRGGSMAWPPRSPDLTLMDSFLWDHIKALIYMSPVECEEHLSARSAEAAATIRQQPSIFERSRQSPLLRCRP